MTLDAQVQKLARMRAFREKYLEEAKAIEWMFNASPQGQLLSGLKSKLTELDTEVAATEEAIRAEAVSQFKATGSRRPHPAVEIKMFKQAIYDAQMALEYARQHIPVAVKLDGKKFEKAALGLDLEFVEILVEPRAQIARDLADYIEE